MNDKITLKEIVDILRNEMGYFSGKQISVILKYDEFDVTISINNKK